jgi:glyoxylase-like metal-dependent hydrolase (beta-lactamase superfamily II)
MWKQRLVPLAFATTLLGAFALAPARQQDRSSVQIRVHPVSGPVSYLEGAGGNIGVSAGADGVLMIDDQFEDLAPKIRAALDGLGSPLELLVNTHHHGDHTGGNGVFGKELLILAHANVRARLAGGERPAAADALPVVTYADGVTLWFNGEEIRVFHVPNAHTDGDSVVWFKGSNVVHMGDLFFAGRFPFVDLDSGGSVRGLAASVKRLHDELPADVKIIPGHGPLATKSDLARYLAMLADVQAAVGKAAEQGQSAADMKAAKLLAPWAEWGWSFISEDRFIDILVRDRQ